MAKKTKTQLIKDALAANPQAAPAEIAKQLAKHKVTAGYVSTIKSSMGGKKKSATKTGKKPGAKKPATKAVSDKVSLSDLVKASKLADELGGVDKARELLNAVAKIK